MFSILSSVLGHLRIAQTLGATPVIDFENFPSTYSEPDPVGGTRNAWEYYFQPVSPFSLDEAYGSAKVLVCDGGHPRGTTMSVSGDPTLLEVFDKHVVLNASTRDYLDARLAEDLVGSNTLGIHYRGQEMRTARSHPFPPTLSQVFRSATCCLDAGTFERIFLLTEGAEYAEAFTQEFGDLVRFTGSYRAFKANAYTTYPRSQHKYLLGLEVLTDMLLLSECGGLISGSSNVSEMAILLNRGRYRVNHQIRNGTNSANPFLAPFLWRAKDLLSPRFGGFPKECR
jgi:hypothetical protein